MYYLSSVTVTGPALNPQTNRVVITTRETYSPGWFDRNYLWMFGNDEPYTVTTEFALVGMIGPKDATPEAIQNFFNNNPGEREEARRYFQAHNVVRIANKEIHDHAGVTANGFYMTVGCLTISAVVAMMMSDVGAAAGGASEMGIGTQVNNPENLNTTGELPAVLKNGRVTIGTFHGSAMDSAGGFIEGSGWVKVDASGNVIEWTRFTPTDGFTPF